MKKYIFLLFLFTCILNLAGCSSKTEDEESSFVPIVIVKRSDTKAELSAEECMLVSNMLNDQKWRNSLWDCACDCTIVINDQPLLYCSDCGTFNDNENIRCTELEEQQRTELNAILSQYITLGEWE